MTAQLRIVAPPVPALDRPHAPDLAPFLAAVRAIASDLAEGDKDRNWRARYRRHELAEQITAALQAQPDPVWRAKLGAYLHGTIATEWRRIAAESDWQNRGDGIEANAAADAHEGVAKAMREEARRLVLKGART